MENLKQTYVEFLNQYPWQWFATLTFAKKINSEGHVNQEKASKMLRDWIRELCKKEGIQVAYCGVFNFNISHHYHLLMFGRSRTRKTLNTVNSERWERHWEGGMAQIKSVYNQVGVSRYMTKNMPSEKHDTFFYNIKLLNKYRRET